MRTSQRDQFEKAEINGGDLYSKHRGEEGGVVTHEGGEYQKGE